MIVVTDNPERSRYEARIDCEIAGIAEDQLAGKRIGTCTSCTVESYLKGTLQIPGIDLVQKVKDPVLVGFETEGPGIDALAAGKLDAFLAAEPVGAQAVKDGKPVRLLDESAFSMYPTGLVD